MQSSSASEYHVHMQSSLTCIIVAFCANHSPQAVNVSDVFDYKFTFLKFSYDSYVHVHRPVHTSLCTTFDCMLL